MQIQLKDSSHLTISEKQMQKALQYSSTSGLEELVQWFRKLQTQVHRPLVDFDICIGNGSQDVLTKALEAFLDPGDTLLMEAPAYSVISNDLV